MKNKQLIFIPIILMIILVGCSNKEYESAMENGKKAVEEEDYEEAKSSFEQALEIESNNEEAKKYLDQTTAIIHALKLFNDGNLKEATKKFNDVYNYEDESTSLQNEAEKYLAKIKDIEVTHHDIDTSLKKAEDLERKGEFTDALALIDETLDQDISHPAFSSINQELASFKIKLQDTEKNFDSIKKAYKKAKKLGENKEYNEALSLIDKTLQNDFAHASFEPLEQDLTKLQTDLVTAKNEIKNDDKAQELINQVMGYWSHKENDYELCQFTKTYFACAVAASDFYYYGRITSWDANLDNKTIIIHGEGNYTSKASLSNSNTLTFGEEKYNRISEQEVNNRLNEFGIDDKFEFFNINRYEEWDSQNSLNEL